MSEYQPLPLPVIDPRNETDLVNEAIAIINRVSNGLLNDFSLNSPLLALIEAQVFVAGELLYYLNRSIPAIAIQYYKNFGIEQKLGTVASVELTFALTNSQATTFTIPANFVVTTNDSKIAFKTANILTIPPNNLSGTVNAVSVNVGSVNNVNNDTIVNISQPLTNLKSVTNLTKANGGSDAETFEQTIERANVLLRTRGLVSGDDYVQMAKSILGQNCLFKTISNLGADKVSFVLGAVHLFGLNANRDPLNGSQLDLLAEKMSDNIHISSSLYISSFSLLPINIELNVVVNVDNDALETCEIINNQLNKFFDSYQESILYYYEIIYAVRDLPVIKQVLSMIINGSDANIQLPNDFTLVKLNRLEISTYSQYNQSLLAEMIYLKG